MRSKPTAAIAAELSAWVIGAGSDSIPPQVRAFARLHMLDTLGCGLAAVGMDAAPAASRIALAQGGAAEASLLGESTCVPAALAALANGTRCHGLDYDDTHEAGICHASAVVAPAALAIGEARRSSGGDVLDAYLLGTEITARIAIRVAEGLYERGFHPTSVCGVFGATAAAARLLKLDARTTTNALGIAGSFASGLFAYLEDGSATKPLHAGWAAQAGVQAANLAAAGATGPERVLEGRFGLMDAYTGDRSDPNSVCEGLGETWQLTDLSLKAFPACHFTHSSTWAAAELAEEERLAPAEIDSITVRIPTAGVALVLDPLPAKREPKTPYDAKFSLPFTVAHRIVRGSLGLTAFAEEAIRDREVLALAARVNAEPLPEPCPSRFGGGARIETVDGRMLDRFVAHAPGSAQNPLPEEWAFAKFRSNAELALEPEHVSELLATLQALEDAPSIAAAMAPVRGAAAIGLDHEA